MYVLGSSQGSETVSALELAVHPEAAVQVVTCGGVQDDCDCKLGYTEEMRRISVR